MPSVCVCGEETQPRTKHRHMNVVLSFFLLYSIQHKTQPNRQKQSLPIHEWGFDLLWTIMAMRTIAIYATAAAAVASVAVLKLTVARKWNGRNLKMALQSLKKISAATAPFHFSFLPRKVNTLHVTQLPWQEWMRVCERVCVSPRWLNQVRETKANEKRMWFRYILAFYVNGCDPFSNGKS